MSAEGSIENLEKLSSEKSLHLRCLTALLGPSSFDVVVIGDPDLRFPLPLGMTLVWTR